MVETNEQTTDEQTNDPAPVPQPDGDGGQAEEKAEDAKTAEEGE
jgi:hypothetical protein